MHHFHYLVFNDSHNAFYQWLLEKALLFTNGKPGQQVSGGKNAESTIPSPPNQGGQGLWWTLTCCVR